MNDSDVIEPEVTPGDGRNPSPDSEPCPIDAAFREVEDTLIDFGVSEETRKRLHEAGEELSEVYQDGKRVVIATKKAIPKLERAWKAFEEMSPIKGKREMLKRSM